MLGQVKQRSVDENVGPNSVAYRLSQLYILYSDDMIYIALALFEFGWNVKVQFQLLHFLLNVWVDFQVVRTEQYIMNT